MEGDVSIQNAKLMKLFSKMVGVQNVEITQDPSMMVSNVELIAAMLVKQFKLMELAEFNKTLVHRDSLVYLVNA